MKKTLITICLVFFATLSCNYVSSGTNDETCSGVSLFKPDGSLATNATVQFYHVGDTSRQFVHQTMTDDSGRYEVKDITTSNGIFNVWAQLGDSLVAIQDSVYITATSHEVMNDTLGKPGSISGTVGLQPGDDPRTVTVQALGTHIYTNVNAEGRFTLGGMAGGEYSLRLTTTLPEYTDTFCNVIAESDVADTIQDTLWLIYTGIPVVKGIVSGYDTLNGVVTLKWNKTGYKDFQDYLIYRDHADSINLSTHPIDRSTDTLFLDTISFSSTTALPFNYRVKIRNNSQKLGESYKLEKVIAVHPRNVITTITSSVFNKSTGLQDDTLSVGDTALIIVNFQNPSRPYKTITWAVGHPDSAVLEKALDTTSISGVDTLNYVWFVEKDYTLYVFLEDCAGTIWNKSCLVCVRDYPSPVVLSVDSIFGCRAYLQWSKSNDIDFKSYHVLCSKSSISSTTPPYSIISNANDTSLRVFDLHTDTTYYFQVLVCDSLNSKIGSNVVIDTTLNLWSIKTSIPTPRSNMVANIVKDKIYIIGGYLGNSQNSNKVEVYDPLIDQWLEKSEMPTYRSDMSSIVVNDNIFVIGGTYTDSNFVRSCTSVEMYDIKNDRWIKKTSMPSSKNCNNPGIFTLGGNIFTVGENLEMYDINSDKWEIVKILNKKIYRVSISYLHNNNYYMFSQANNSLYKLSLETNSIDSIAHIDISCNTKEVYYSSGCKVNKYLYFFGGGEFNGMTFDPLINVWRYNINLNRLSLISKMNKKRDNSIAVKYNSKIYVIGGYDSWRPGPVTTVEEYDLSKE